MMRRARSATPNRTAGASLSVMFCAAIAALGIANRAPAQSREPVVPVIPPEPSAQALAAPQPITAADVFRALESRPRGERSGADRALRAGLEFCLAAGVGGGAHAARLIDAIGYQALPLEGELPLDPQRPIRAAQIAASIAALPESGVDRVGADRFQLVGKTALAAPFAAASEWMLPDDHALLLEPDPQRPRWIQRPACLIIRLRGGEATIVAGNLFDALPAPDRDPSATPPAMPTTQPAVATQEPSDAP